MEDLKQKYRELYDYMATSKKTEYMKAFGKVMTEMFDWFATNRKEAAEEWLLKLEGIRWDNYLTPSEAEHIIDKMQPKAPWSREVWKNAMEEHGLTIEDKPHYNKCALWVEMSKQFSDSSDTIAKIMDIPKNEVPSDRMFKAVYHLALDMLKDADHVYNIRHYFKV